MPDICLLLIGIFGIFLLKNKEKEKTYLNVCVAEQSAYLSRHNLIGRHVTGPFAHVAPLAAVPFARKSLLIDGSSAFDCPLILDKWKQRKKKPSLQRRSAALNGDTKGRRRRNTRSRHRRTERTGRWVHRSTASRQRHVNSAGNEQIFKWAQFATSLNINFYLVCFLIKLM